MPLQAIVNGNICLAPLMSLAEWLLLRKTKPSIELVCCGAQGFPRISSGGLQHFYHRSGHSNCSYAKESARHLEHKLAVLQGARDAGWEAELEAASADGSWRADVLARRGGNRVAFETQLSRIGLADLADRRHKYAESNVRDAWFIDASALKMGELRRQLKSDAMPRDFFRQCPEPLFECCGKEVRIDTVQLPARQAVAALLAGHFRYQLRRKVIFERVAHFYRARGCPKCGGTFTVYMHAVRRTPACNPRANGVLGAHIETDRITKITSSERAAIQSFAKAHSMEFPPLSWPSFISETSSHPYVGFRCPTCRSPMPRNAWSSLVKRNYSRELPSMRVYPQGSLLLGTNIVISEEGHWCHSNRRQFCDSK